MAEEEGRGIGGGVRSRGWKVGKRGARGSRRKSAEYRTWSIKLLIATEMTARRYHSSDCPPLSRVPGSRLRVLLILRHRRFPVLDSISSPRLEKRATSQTRQTDPTFRREGETGFALLVCLSRGRRRRRARELARTSHLARLTEAWNRGLPATLAAKCWRAAPRARNYPPSSFPFSYVGKRKLRRAGDISGGAEHEDPPGKLSGLIAREQILKIAREIFARFRVRRGVFESKTNQPPLSLSPPCE